MTIRTRTRVRTIGLLILLISVTSFASTGTLNNKEAQDKGIGRDIGGDFVLTDHNDQPFKLIDQRGKLVLIFFGYTFCPDICSTELSSLSRVLHSLDQNNKVVALFITIDPNRDTAEKLKQYVPFYSSLLTGLTGTQRVIDDVADAYHVQRRIHAHEASDKNYRVDHSANLYVVNGKGKLVNIIPFGLPVEHMQKVIEMEFSLLH